MSYTNFKISVDTHFDHYDECALSVFCLPDCDDGEEVARKCPKFRSDVFRETTVGEIRKAGYEIVGNEPPKGHALIKQLSSSREHWKRLKSIFGGVKANPDYE